jgi:hypothetical protein
MAQPDNVDHLLGAFAAGTLTPAEQEALYAAALRDQRVFDALAEEEGFKEFLSDPAIRRRLLEELQPAPNARRHTAPRWRHWWTWTAAGSAVAATLAIVIGTHLYTDRGQDDGRSIEDEDRGRSRDALPASPDALPIEKPASKPTEQQETPVGPRPPTVERIPLREAEPAVSHSKERGHQSAAAPPHTPEPSPARPSGKSLTKREQALTRPLKKEGEPAKAPSTTPPPAAPQEVAPPPTANAVPASPPAHALALFYGSAQRPAATPARSEEAAEDANHAEAEQNGLARTGATKDTPLAVRYSLVITGPDGLDREVDPDRAISVADRPRLSVQTNQDGYLWITDVGGRSETAIVPTTARPAQARSPVLFPLAGLMTNPAVQPVLRVQVVFALQPLTPTHLITVPRAPLIEDRVVPVPGGPAEYAVYVAVTPSSMAQVLTAELNLTQRP